jgi:hypothetical protein
MQSRDRGCKILETFHNPRTGDEQACNPKPNAENERCKRGRIMPVVDQDVIAETLNRPVRDHVAMRKTILDQHPWSADGCKQRPDVACELMAGRIFVAAMKGVRDAGELYQIALNGTRCTS